LVRLRFRKHLYICTQLNDNLHIWMICILDFRWLFVSFWLPNVQLHLPCTQACQRSPYLLLTCSVVLKLLLFKCKQWNCWWKLRSCRASLVRYLCTAAQPGIAHVHKCQIQARCTCTSHRVKVRVRETFDGGVSKQGSKPLTGSEQLPATSPHLSNHNGDLSMPHKWRR